MSVCSNCNEGYVQLFCVNEPPLPDDLRMCGACWMARALNEGLALSAAERARASAVAMYESGAETMQRLARERDEAREALRDIEGMRGVHCQDECRVSERMAERARAALSTPPAPDAEK